MGKAIQVIESIVGEVDILDYEVDQNDYTINFLFDELDGKEEGYAWLRRTSENTFKIISLSY